jgi:hypothetical protein
MVYMRTVEGEKSVKLLEINREALFGLSFFLIVLYVVLDAITLVSNCCDYMGVEFAPLFILLHI